MGIKVLEPAVWPVVNGQPENRRVVGVHDAMHETDSHPVDDHFGCAPADFGKPLPNHALPNHAIVELAGLLLAQMRKVGADCMANKFS